MPLKVHPDIAALVPYVPGKPIEELQRELGLPRAIKLASNENPIGPSPKALSVLGETASTLHRYPDGGAFRLRGALAERWKVGPDQVILGNGSDEILGLLARTFLSPGDEAVMAQHTFVIYKMEVTAAHGVAVEVPQHDWHHDLPAMVEAITDRTRLLFVCNPNNPTGTMSTKAEVAALMARVPDHVVVVFDEPITNMSGIRSSRIRSGMYEPVAPSSCCGPFPKFTAWRGCASGMGSPLRKSRTI